LQSKISENGTQSLHTTSFKRLLDVKQTKYLFHCF
jgi:hypothetical protein